MLILSFSVQISSLLGVTLQILNVNNNRLKREEIIFSCTWCVNERENKFIRSEIGNSHRTCVKRNI